MNKTLVLFVFLMMVVSAIVLPLPSNALVYGMDSNLSTASASFWGEGSGDGSGYSVKIAGDVNGDGYDDILIGAPQDDDGGSNAGQTYLVLGKASGLTMDMHLSNADASFWGENAGDDSGISVAGAGDVNGDGYDDILIGAYYNDAGGTDAGQTYLVLGKPSGWAMDTDLSSANASFWGENWNDLSGYSVAGAGDVNGDGYDDILIGAYQNSDGGSNSGKSYLIFGKASGWTMDTDLSNADASFVGENALDESGMSVAGAGDVNGDGYDDFLIGAIMSDDGGANAGQTYLIFGKTSGWAMGTDLSKADASFLGENPSDISGYPVAGAGDVNGDGYDDFLIGAYGNPEGGTYAGQTYLIFGKASGWAMDTGLSNADASFWGENANDYSGFRNAGEGDVNGDGYDDILIGAAYNNEGGSYIGQTYLILGKASGLAMDSKLSKADASFRGENSYDYSGISVADGGDVNGDGHDDILIGADNNAAGGAGSGQTYLIFVDKNTKPTNVNSVKAYPDNSYSLGITTASVNDTVFIELRGTDGDQNNNSIALVRVTSSSSDQMGFALRLLETGKNTGIYRGNLTIKDRTRDRDAWIKAFNGETVNITSVQDPSKYCTVLVKPIVKLFPLFNNGTAVEDMAYSEHFWTKNHLAVQWTFHTNASWLGWNTTTHNISGTPDNGDIGSYYVRINITHPIWGSDEHNFTLVVNNTPPVITKNNVLSVLEDKDYRVDYNSTDDGQGTVTYHLKTNTSKWLSIDQDSGILNGTPANDDIGRHYVNVSVDDGNGGLDWSNFTLEVVNTNDPPHITTTDVTTAIEHKGYDVGYTAVDVDVGDVLTWKFDTNASWLSFDNVTHHLYGAPWKTDVGWFWVRVGVSDRAGATDFHNFTLAVLNVNDPPLITTKDIGTAYEDSPYSVKCNATEWDYGDVLTWHLTTNATGWFTINGQTGLLSGIPVNDDVGSYWVNVSVTDKAMASDFHNFTLVVLNTNDAPEITSIPILNATVHQAYVYDVNATDVDIGTVLEYSLELGPDNMYIDGVTGRIDWTPNDTQVGNNFVKVKVTDGIFPVSQSFVISVKGAVVQTNHRPEIVVIPDKTVNAKEEFVYHVGAYDADAGDVLSYRLEGQPYGMAINATGVITWTPTIGQVGAHTVTVNVSDGKDSTTRSFIITVKAKGTRPSGGLDPMLIGAIAGAVIAAIAILVGLLLWMRKAKAEPAAPSVQAEQRPPAEHAVPTARARPITKEAPRKKGK